MRQEEIYQISQIVKTLKSMQHELNECWKKELHQTRNLKHTNISDVWFPSSDTSSEFFLELQAYSILASGFVLDILESGPNIRARAKQPYSILAKLQKYITAKEQGKVAISKCLNDLLGTRIIVSNDTEYVDMLEELQTYFVEDKNVRVVKSFHGSYNAIHIYIQEENSTFPWELQIWKQEDELTNEASHRKYKQEYADDSPEF
jgi:hypothetical protein